MQNAKSRVTERPHYLLKKKKKKELLKKSKFMDLYVRQK